MYRGEDNGPYPLSAQRRWQRGQTHVEVIYEANPTDALFQMLTQP